MLYLGSDRGVLVSADDGASWRELRLNLPTVPVHDLVVKDDDLVLATHGRSVWILDDLAPVREWTAAVAEEPVHLFSTPPAVRWSATSPVSGHEKGPGANPPAGALVSYWLREPATGEVTLEILDAKGALVRRLSSVEKEHEPADDPDLEKEPAKPLPVKAGVQRAAWDLRYEGATKIKGAKVDSGEPEQGPSALPGSYTARLTVAGRSLTTPVEVRADPRSTVAREELEEQLAFALALRDDLSRLSRIVGDLRSVREQAKARAFALRGRPAAAPVADAAMALVSKCDVLEDALHNPRAQVTYDILAMRGGARLYSRLAPLYSAVSEGEGRPTRGMREVYAQLKKELDARAAEWKAIAETDLPALNAKARELAPDLVVLPFAPPSTR
jgi:hypothetical protein